jgi:hypothetical protein
MWRYGKLKGKFSDGEMNDRFTDMGFSQGHQSCGGRPIFQSGKSTKPWAREGALKPWHTWGSNPQLNGVDIVILMSSTLTTRPPSCLRRCQKKKTRISESRKPEKVETQNGEMISISPLHCRNLEFLLFRLCVFAFTISRFNFVFQNPKAKSNIL